MTDRKKAETPLERWIREQDEFSKMTADERLAYHKRQSEEARAGVVKAHAELAEARADLERAKLRARESDPYMAAWEAQRLLKKADEERRDKLKLIQGGKKDDEA